MNKFLNQRPINKVFILDEEYTFRIPGLFQYAMLLNINEEVSKVNKRKNVSEEVLALALSKPEVCQNILTLIEDCFIDVPVREMTVEFLNKALETIAESITKMN